jgi:hypothetical protein
MTNPYVPIAPFPTSTVNYRTLASAIAVFLGGYLVVSALTGQLVVIVSGISSLPVEYALLTITQALFAVAVVVGGLMLAPAPIATRLLASAIVVVIVVVCAASAAARITGTFGSVGVPVSMTLANGYFMAVLAIGAAWLIVRSARMGWLAALATVVLIPIPYLFAVSGIPTGYMQLVALVLCALIGAGIVLAGRPLRD